MENEEALQMQQKIAELEANIRPFFTKKALERLLNLKIAHPDKYVQSMAVVAQLVQSGRVKMLEDGQFKEILIKLNEKKEFTINR